MIGYLLVQNRVLLDVLVDALLQILELVLFLDSAFKRALAVLQEPSLALV